MCPCCVLVTQNCKPSRPLWVFTTVHQKLRAVEDITLNVYFASEFRYVPLNVVCFLHSEETCASWFIGLMVASIGIRKTQQRTWKITTWTMLNRNVIIVLTNRQDNSQAYSSVTQNWMIACRCAKKMCAVSLRRAMSSAIGLSFWSMFIHRIGVPLFADIKVLAMISFTVDNIDDITNDEMIMQDYSVWHYEQENQDTPIIP